MKTTKVEITIVDSSDPSVQCIHALRQVMDLFEAPSAEIVRKLSLMGKDKQAVYAWFVNRYGTPPVWIPEINESRSNGIQDCKKRK